MRHSKAVLVYLLLPVQTAVTHRLLLMPAGSQSYQQDGNNHLGAVVLAQWQVRTASYIVLTGHAMFSFFLVCGSLYYVPGF